MALTPSTMLPLGTTAPGFKLPDTDESLVSLDDFKNAPALLVIFLCNHCPYVKHVRHELARLGEEYQQKGVAVVGISANDVATHPEDSPVRMAAEKAEVGYTFPYLYDETQTTCRRLTSGHVVPMEEEFLAEMLSLPAEIDVAIGVRVTAPARPGLDGQSMPSEQATFPIKIVDQYM